MNKEQFIEKSRAVHGDKYKYENTEWTGTQYKVAIECPTHGVFWQKAYNHYYCKSGCPACGGRPIHTTESYIEAARSLHGSRFTYEKTVYVKARDKLTVTCAEHGDFTVQASSLITGSGGCVKCKGSRVSENRAAEPEDFIPKALAVHGSKYDYSETVYHRVHSKVNIRCHEHGLFSMQPANHLSGNGCPGCAKTGFNPRIPGYLYVLEAGDIVKVGITNKGIQRRVKDVSRSSGLSFKCIHKHFFTSGVDAANLEQELISDLATRYRRVGDKFNGSTECFFDVNIQQLIHKISQK